MKYNVSEIMKKAHAMAKELVGDYAARMSYALRQVWKEVKKMAEKIKFERFAKVVIVGRENYTADDESKFLTFKIWEKNGKSRIYINDYKRRTIGFIDIKLKKAEIINNCGLLASELSTVEKFIAEYDF